MLSPDVDATAIRIMDKTSLTGEEVTPVIPTGAHAPGATGTCCDKNEHVWREDSGLLTIKSDFPVSS